VPHIRPRSGVGRSPNAPPTSARSAAQLVDLVPDQGLGGGQLVGLAAQERLGEALGLLELDPAGQRWLVGVDDGVD
jgi:hypothetical protein